MDDSLERELAPLLELARRGDTKAFGQFFDLTASNTYTLVLRLVPRHRAEDVLADVYGAAWRALAGAPPVRSPADWLTGICLEVAGAWLRRADRGPPVD